MVTDALIIRDATRDLCKAPESVTVTELYRSPNQRQAELATRVKQVLREVAEQCELKRNCMQQAQRAPRALLAPP